MDYGIEIPDEALLDGPYDWNPCPLYPESEEELDTVI